LSVYTTEGRLDFRLRAHLPIVKNLPLSEPDMRIVGHHPIVVVALFVWFGVFGTIETSGQVFRRKPMRKATDMIRRQAPPEVNPAVEPLIGPDNARVVISLSKQRAYVFAGDQLYIDTPVSTGKKSSSTPAGSFKITEKDIDHRSSIYGDFVDKQGRVVRSGVSLKVDSAPSGTRYRGAPMMYFMRLTNSGVGMHVGILPGYPASHGCIRLPSQIAPLIYHKVKIGTPVVIEQ
jgi:lipoprotein-anchoring transpeptidase ErfK/SrfK